MQSLPCKKRPIRSHSFPDEKSCSCPHSQQCSRIRKESYSCHRSVHAHPGSVDLAHEATALTRGFLRDLNIPAGRLRLRLRATTACIACIACNGAVRVRVTRRYGLKDPSLIEDDRDCDEGEPREYQCMHYRLLCFMHRFQRVEDPHGEAFPDFAEFYRTTRRCW